MTIATDRRGTGTARLFRDTVIRVDPLGYYWLMNRPDEGWGSAGRRYRSPAEIVRIYAVRLGEPSSDEHSPIIPVVAL